MDKRIEKLINKMQENAAKIPKPTRNIEEDNRIEQALKNTTTRPETKKFLENMIAANAYANAQLQMEDMANLAKELSEKYPLKESDPYFSFVSYEDDNEHPAMQHIGKLSLRAADELLVAMDMQIRENRNAIKEELKWAGEENIENNPRYKAWDVKFPTEYQVYDSENNLIADMPFPMGYETEEKDRVEKYDKYGLFADLLKTRGSLFQYSLDKEKELQLERNTLLEKQKKGIVMDINGFPIDIELTRNKEDIEKNQYRKAELKKDIREIFEFREQCYGTEIPKQLDMEVPESIIPALTNSIDSYEWERQERERNKEFSIGDHVRCLKDGKIILGKIVDIDIMALGDWSPRTWSIQPDGSKEIVDIEELFVYDYILEKDNFKEKKEMENKEGKSVGEKWLKEQGKQKNL